MSTGLKDLIGRDLITDDFVAIFELVKNAFDAHASHVAIRFDEDEIIIADNGKGMSRRDIIDKWLFVAYSAKRDGTEDNDYRDKVRGHQRTFAGAKGVGRFSCDRLGAHLELSTRARGQRVEILEVDWTLYERNSKEEFIDIPVQLSENDAFPVTMGGVPRAIGTVLRISGLRASWDREKLRLLKRELTKLIDPFGGSEAAFRIEIAAPAERDEDESDSEYNRTKPDDKATKLIVNGPVENPILDVLRERTTAIRVRLIEKGKSLETTLEDRGELIYRIREKNEYESLEATAFKSDIYFLNRSAKATFARRMGLPSVQFGAIFLFRNGFRVFPIGSEQDDFFGLNRRKQQGQRRFLGGRDLIGRVDIRGTPNFNEATSRNQGLIRNEHVEQLIRCVIEKCVRRLERYVVDISWKDDFDTDVVDTSRMLLDESSARISELVSKLAASKGVELIEYNSSLVRIVDEKSSEFETSLRALEILAEKTGDKRLLRRIKGAQERIKALQDAEAEAREAGMRAEQRALAAEGSAAVAEAKYADEVQRNDFLVAAASLDEDTILNLHHQIIIHAADVHHKIQSMMGKLRGSADIPRKDWIDLLEKISYRNSQILTAARFATKGGYKQQSAEVESDLAIYIQDYVQTVSLLWAPQGILPEITNDASGFVRRFKPIEVGIVVDNLVSNSSKARATSVGFFLSRPRKTELEILVADDGAGWAQDLSHLERIFEKGTTTSNGSGLGLYHVRQVIESMGGTIEARKEAYSERFDGACLVIRLPK